MSEAITRSQTSNANIITEESSAIAEIEAKIILAKRFPRDMNSVRDAIYFECENKELAEKATYAYPRGDSVVKGASIRLVEAVARHWGNILSGIKEISSDGTKATVKAYCWDLQTNFADEKVFDIEYKRDTKKGSYYLTDIRDKYEVLANMAARRKRACMQAIIPKFIIDEAIEHCQKTLERAINQDGDIETTKAKMLQAFQALESWITKEHLETVCAKDFDKFTVKDIVKLRNLYNAIKDGFVVPQNAFGVETPQDKVMDEQADLIDDLSGILGGDKENA